MPSVHPSSLPALLQSSSWRSSQPFIAMSGRGALPGMAVCPMRAGEPSASFQKGLCIFLVAGQQPTSCTLSCAVIEQAKTWYRPGTQDADERVSVLAPSKLPHPRQPVLRWEVSPSLQASAFYVVSPHILQYTLGLV